MMATLPSSLGQTTPGNAYTSPRPPSSPSLPGSRELGTRKELPAVTTKRDPKESNGEQAQALVSCIYFSFCWCLGLVSQNTLQ